MKLLTKELIDKIPPLYAQEQLDDPWVYAKFFALGTSWSWYVLEFDGSDTFFGLVTGFEDELGYISIKELESLKWNGIPRVERDLHFSPCPLSKVKCENF